MNILKAFESPYLKAIDFNDIPGKAIALTFASVNMEDFVRRGKHERFPVASFSNCKKLFVIKTTNGGTLAGLLGEETEHWIGRSVLFFQDTCQYGGEPTPCIRIKAVPITQPGENLNTPEQPTEDVFRVPVSSGNGSPSVIQL